MATSYVTMRTESIPGNQTSVPTYSTKRTYFPALNFQPSPNPAPLMRDDEIRNVDQPLLVVPERYTPEWSIESRLYPDTTGHLLTLMLGQPTTTAGDGIITDPDSVVIPTGAHRHVWTAPFGPAGITPLTAFFQAAYKDQSVFMDVKGAACSTMGITTPNEGGARITASGPALYMPSPVADPSLSPVYEALTIPPFMRSNAVTVTWLTGTAATEDFSLSISNPVEATQTFGFGSRWPDTMEKTDTPVTFTGSIPKRQIDQQDMDALMAATAFAAKVRWTNTAIIASGYPYKFFVEFDSAQYVAGAPGPVENRRRIPASFDFKATFDGAGASVTLTLVNATTSYA